MHRDRMSGGREKSAARQLADRVAAAVNELRAASGKDAPSPATAAGGPGKCIHLGGPTGETVECLACRSGKVKLRLYACSIHGTTVPTVKQATARSCIHCPDFKPQ